EIPREMIQSGDWVVPRLNGLRYFEKPVLGYWVVAGSMKLIGQNEFAARLPAALSVGLSAIVVGLLARRFASATTADLAPAVFLRSFGVYPAGNFNWLDGPFSALMTATFATSFAALHETGRFRKTIILAAAGGFCGLAFLVKGFAAFALA